MRSPLAGWETMFGTLIALYQAIAIYYQTYRVDHSFLNAKKVLNKGVLSTVKLETLVKKAIELQLIWQSRNSQSTLGISLLFAYLFVCILYTLILSHQINNDNFAYYRQV